MFSKTAVYALRAMTQLANSAPGLTTTAAIAKSTGVPPGYLAKVMQDLRRGGLVKATRGVHGGVKLAKPANKISLLDVINVVEPLKRSSKGNTPLSRKLDALVSDARKTTAATTLADVAKGKR